jgi:hypothetical protein
MNSLNELADRYIAAWNETDATRRHDLIARTYTEDATYVDPVFQSEGQEGIADMIAAAQAQFPGNRFRRVSEVDAHHDRIRFTWELGPEGSPALAGGVDFAVVEGDRLRAVTGFFDFTPQPGKS